MAAAILNRTMLSMYRTVMKIIKLLLTVIILIMMSQVMITARKTIFPKSWNIIESSKRPRKYHLSINLFAEKKTLFPITKKLKTRTSQ